MNIKFNILLIVSLIFLISFVSASIYENNFVKLAIIENDTFINYTSTTIPGANIAGYNCSSTPCTTISGILFSSIPIPGINMTILYPNILNFQGYGLYIYKTGYISFERFSNYSYSGAGDVYAPNADDYLAQKRTCNSSIQSSSASSSNGTLTILANVTSPITDNRLFTNTPTELLSYYSVNVSVSFNVSGNQNYFSALNLSIPFSGVKSALFSNNVSDGQYNITITATSNDAICLNSLSVSSLISNFNSTGANTNSTNLTSTVPGSISNLNLTYLTNSTAIFNWTNPSSNFNGTLIYLGTNNIANLTSNNNSYPLSGLAQNTTYNFTVYTFNDFGINWTGISNIFTTLTNSQAANLTNGTITNSTQLLMNVISPLWQPYNISSITFNISLNNPGSAIFNLNNGNNISFIPLNSTYLYYNYTGLVNGTYILSIFANDSAGNKNSSRVFFTVTLPSNSSSITNTTNSTSSSTQSSSGNSGASSSSSRSSSPGIYYTDNTPISLSYFPQNESTIILGTKALENNSGWSWLFMALEILMLLAVLFIIMRRK